MIRFASALLALVVVLGPAWAQTERRTFRDWMAGATPAYLGWVGTAETASTGTRLARFELLRAAAPEAPWHVVLVTPKPLDRTRPLTLELDGNARVIPPESLIARDAPEALTLQHGEALQELERSLRRAKSLAITGTDRTGAPVKARFSLNGLAAAMLWLDEKQGRVGRPQRFGPIPVPAQGPFHAPAPDRAARDESGIRVTVALPRHDTWPPDLRELPPAVLERHALLGSCDEPDFAAGAGSFWTARLDPWTTLYGVSCTRGAYNVADRLYLVTGGDFQNLQPLTFAEPDGVDGWDTADVLVNAGVDESTGTLTAFNKGRGLGDCGTLGTWAWTGQEFSLREYRAEPLCNGRTSEAWPVLFRARPR